RLPDSRQHPETLPLGKAAALLYSDRNLPGSGIDRSRDSRHRHLSGGGHRPAPAHRSAVDRIDDRGGPVGVVGTGARYCDARPARDEAVSLLVRAARRLELRPGKQPIYTKATDKRILKLLDKPPPQGFARWTGPLLAEALGDVDVQYVWRFLRSHKIDLVVRKSWCESNDPNFTAMPRDNQGE